MEARKAGFAHLEDLVAEALERLHSTRGRAERAEARVRELESQLNEGIGGDPDADLVARLDAAEVERQELRARLARGREGVERLLARIRFLEERQ